MSAYTAQDALIKVKLDINSAIESKGIIERRSGMFRTRYMLDSFLEIECDAPLNESSRGGLIFYPFGPIHRMALWVRFVLFKWSKPYLTFCLD